MCCFNLNQLASTKPGAIHSDVLHYCRRTSPCNFRTRAPLYFLSGFLFSADAFELYEGLPQPVWIAHGVRGDFTDYHLEGRLLSKDNWSGEVFRRARCLSSK